MVGLFSAVANLGIQDPAESENRDVIDLYNYWLNQRDSKGLFNYRSFDVLDLPRHLISKVNLIKVHSDGTRFEHRIVGGDITEQAGLNITRRFIDDMPGAEIAQKRMEFCAKNNLPYAASGRLTWGAHDFKRFDVLTVPLHDDDGKVVYLVSVMCIHSTQPAETVSTQLNISCSNLPPEDIAIFDQAFDFWIQSKGSSRLPLKAKIVVTRIPNILPNIMLCDVLEEPLDFKIKLVGEAIKAVIASDNLSKGFREQSGKMPGSKIWAYYETVYETGIPRYSKLEYEGPDKGISHVLNLLLPYSNDETKVSHILNVIKVMRK